MAQSDVDATQLACRIEVAKQFFAGGTNQRPIGSHSRARVGQAFDRLSARDREVLALRYMEQLSTRDAGVVLGISEAAFTKRHVRAIRRLRELLDAPDDRMRDHGDTDGPGPGRRQYEPI